MFRLKETAESFSKSSGSNKRRESKESSGSKEKDATTTTEEKDSAESSENEWRAKRTRGTLTEEEYEFIARDIMSKPPLSGYLKYHLPLRYAARTEEVRWVWRDPKTGRNVYKDLIGGGRNSDLEYD